MVVASLPRHIDVEGGNQVEQCPGDQHIVVHTDEAGYNEHSPPNTCKQTKSTSYYSYGPYLHNVLDAYRGSGNLIFSFTDN